MCNVFHRDLNFKPGPPTEFVMHLSSDLSVHVHRRESVLAASLKYEQSTLIPSYCVVWGYEHPSPEIPMQFCILYNKYLHLYNLVTLATFISRKISMLDSSRELWVAIPDYLCSLPASRRLSVGIACMHHKPTTIIFLTSSVVSPLIVVKMFINPLWEILATRFTICTCILVPCSNHLKDRHSITIDIWLATYYSKLLWVNLWGNITYCPSCTNNGDNTLFIKA